MKINEDEGQRKKLTRKKVPMKKSNVEDDKAKMKMIKNRNMIMIMIINDIGNRSHPTQAYSCYGDTDRVNM
ncbi:hypothetical protein S83_008885, partial [Arachis hypogaea]